MSKKIKAKSQTKKIAPKKVAKKVVEKKKTAKKSVKSKPVKKASIKSKVTVKKVVKKAATKKVAVKKMAKKITVKKTSKPIKKAVKKVAPKKAVKPVIKKATAKKIAVVKKVKIAPLKSKATKTVKVEKPVIVKAPIVKVEKSIKTPKEKIVAVKKPIVAPTTFRNVDTTPVSTKVMKEPAGKFEMEFVIRASEDMVFEFVSTESGLSEWFCDDVNIRDGVFTFDWDGQVQQAKLVKEIPPQFIRYQWLDKNDGSYFEFRIQKDELTNDISLIITDFASDKADEASSRLLWHSQVDKLLHVLGSFF